MPDREENVQVEGEVLESFQAGMYRVGLNFGHEALAYVSGRMRSGDPADHGHLPASVEPEPAPRFER